MMTVLEVQQRAQTLRVTIRTMLHEFEKLTGCRVDSIELHRDVVGYVAGGAEMTLPHIDLTIQIPTP
jgi:hypothetical protein